MSTRSSVSVVGAKLLLGRVLTRSGDQAWDFIVPFALLHVFPGKIQIAALYFLIMKVGTLLLTPSVGKWIDANQRLLVVRVGVFLQFIAVLAGVICFYLLDAAVDKVLFEDQNAPVPLFIILSIFGILASLGSVITDISVGNDLAPALIESSQLTHFNSWLRRIDLTTEVCAPILAGVLFTLHSDSIHLLGLILVAAWNLISFVPEYLLLSNVITLSGLQKKASGSTQTWKAMLQFDFKKTIASPIFWLVFSYALLWLSVLSPHGVLLAAYLKDKMSLPESQIGLFRGLGAVFGLLSTITFPYFVKKLGLIKSSKLHLFFQGLTLLTGLAFLIFDSNYGIYTFLGFILLSRVGLYGFSNGEFELRQRLIPESQRGELNALSFLTTTLATLILFAAGSLLPSTEGFIYLVYVSVFAVLTSNLVFFKWTKDNKLEV